MDRSFRFCMYAQPENIHDHMELYIAKYLNPQNVQKKTETEVLFR